MDHRRDVLDRRRSVADLCKIDPIGPILTRVALRVGILPFPMSTPEPFPPAPTIVIRASPQISAIRLILALIAILVALFLGLLVLLVIGIETGPVALMLGFITATIPVPIYISLVLWIDRYEAEPLWMLATAFFWGALIATFFAFLLNTTSLGIVYSLTDSKTGGEAFAAVISAPIVEETGKAVILFIFFFCVRKNSMASLTGSCMPRCRRLVSR